MELLEIFQGEGVGSGFSLVDDVQELGFSIVVGVEGLFVNDQRQGKARLKCLKIYL